MVDRYIKLLVNYDVCKKGDIEKVVSFFYNKNDGIYIKPKNGNGALLTLFCKEYELLPEGWTPNLQPLNFNIW